MYAYQEAEAVLDIFAAEPGRKAQFRRAYMRLKCLIFAQAYSDFSGGKMPTKEMLSYVWEDLQIAFAGHGEATLTGAVLHLWGALDDKEVPLFKAAVEEAFRLADEATPVDTKRRYLLKYRAKPIRMPWEAFNLPTLLPSWGPTLRDWAFDNDEDPEDYEDEYDLITQVINQADVTAAAPRPSAARSMIHLLEKP